MRELLAAGADPNKYKDSAGWTALIRAAFWGRDSTVSILIHHGADLNIQTKDGETALEMAASGEYYDVILILMEAGAEVPPSSLVNRMMNTDPSKIS